MTRTVLLVDDVPAERQYLRMALEQLGDYAIAGEAGDGREAIDQAAALQPDLVLLDLSMPDIDGLEALPRIKAVSPDSVVVVLSGLGATEVASTALRLGAAAYLEKGLRLRDLVDEIDHIPRSGTQMRCGDQAAAAAGSPLPSQDLS